VQSFRDISVHDRYVDVGGVRTHYLEAGDGSPVVLLHSGEYGGCAELTWEHNIGPLARDFRVIAPDWLGFGGTDKIRDFVSGSDRMVSHLARFIETLALTSADFVGCSMGGTCLIREAAQDRPRLPIRRMVVASGGGLAPDNEHRRAIQSYDGTEESMRRVLVALFENPRWWNDDDYVARRVRLSKAPGAWEAVSAAQLKAPWVPERSGFGGLDTIPYENVQVPTLLIAGDHDKLREPGYADPLQRRMPHASLTVFRGCGHMVNIEQPERFNLIVSDFLAKDPSSTS
jgi:2-hydroxymuconate-semialdehyde hydrolase